MRDAITNFEELKLTHFSPSQLLKPLAVWMFQYVALTAEQRSKIKVGYKARYGTAVHFGIQKVVAERWEMEKAVETCQTLYDLRETSKKDDEVFRAYREKIAPCIQNGVNELQKNLQDYEIEKSIKLELPDLVLPIIGFVDFISDTEVTDLKTKIGNLHKPKKDGTRTLGNIKLPTEPIERDIQQVAIYQAATHVNPSIIYVSHNDCVRFDKTNCEAFHQSNLDDAVEKMRQRALKRQKLIAVSNDPYVLGGILEADFDHPFYWDDEDNIELAKEIFKV
tara:strand:- start:4623 stop:5459 length:837 start_codon:yes stop_codon:yes gene_type:complete